MDDETMSVQSDSSEDDLDLFESSCEVEEEEELLGNEVEQVPKVGMTFETLDEAKKFYNAYAKRNGFSARTRRTATLTSNPSIIRAATLVCSAEGEYVKVKTPQKRRDNKRFGCLAMIKLQFSNDKYILKEFVEEHTHELARPDCVHLLRSQRGITEPQAILMNQMKAAGIKTSKINAFMRHVAGGAQNLNFTSKDCHNYFQRDRRKFLKKGDVKCLREWFREKKKESKHFFHSFWLDDSNQVRGVFFCDAKSRRDYGLFGNVISFDTTFKTNNYDMVCAPFVGVNHHWQTTLFGCGLLDGETTEAISWLFTTFLEAMGGKAPQVIFTDESAAIAAAIVSIFPETHHRLCLWHIYQNVAKKLASKIAEFKDFAPALKKCVYNPETIVEFEESWAKMLVTFNATDNGYLKKLYDKRMKWALAYGRAHFCADMTTTQRSESINKFLKDFFGTKTLLREFVNQYVKAMQDRREIERIEDNRFRQTTPIMFGTWKVESEASKLYTRKMFGMFQEEYKMLGDLKLEMVNCVGTTCTYSVLQLDGKGRTRMLTYDKSDDSVSCSCRKFDWEGVLCCHALKLFRELCFTNLPSKYYLKRWTKAITEEFVLDPSGELIPNDSDPFIATRYSELSHISQRIVSMSATSSTRFALTKKGLLELEEKIASENSNADCGNTSRRGEENDNSDSDGDESMKDPKSKRVRGQQKNRKKAVLERKRRKKNPSRKEVRQDENVVREQPIPLPNLNETRQDSFGSMTEVPLYHNSWQCPPYIGSQESQSVARRLFASSCSDWSTSLGQSTNKYYQPSGIAIGGGSSQGLKVQTNNEYYPSSGIGSSSHGLNVQANNEYYPYSGIAIGDSSQGLDVHAKIMRLMALGFGREAVMVALRVCNGNEEHAVRLLIGS